MNRLLILCALIFPSTSSFAAPVDGDAKTLVAQLDNADDKQVQAALEGLKDLGADGVDGLLKATKHKQVWVRASAWRWLGELGADAQPALGPLCAALALTPRDEWASVMEFVMGFGMQEGLIGMMVTGGPLKHPKGQSKAEEVEFDNMCERLAAMSAFVKIGTTDFAALMPLIEKTATPLDRGYCDLHVCFSTIASKLKEEGRSVVAAGLTHPSPRVQVASLLACPFVAEDSSVFGASVIKLLDSPEVGVRGLAAEVLIGMRHPCDVFSERLMELTRDESAYVRMQAARAAASGCDQAEAVLPVLEKCISDPSVFTRIAAIDALNNLAGGSMFAMRSKKPPFRPESAVKPLTAALTDKNVEVRRRAASTLGNYGPIAAPALPALRKATADPDKRVRAAAEVAVEAIEKS